jgi:hypothetical protein
LLFRQRDFDAARENAYEWLRGVEGDGRSSLTYVKPSSLMVVELNPQLLSAAHELDAKLAALATSGS